MTDHCNLRCAECCSLSPYLDRRLVTPEAMAEDLRRACRVLAPTYLKLVGGEPLLHPKLLECLRLAKALDVAPILSVTTNGLLIRSMPDEFWTLLNALTLSLYPSPVLPSDLMDFIFRQTRRFNVTLNIKRQSLFVCMTRWDRSENTAETTAIFAGCWLRSRCHIVQEGRFYQCTRPPHFHTLFHERKPFDRDGVVLHDGLSLKQEILDDLVRTEPLEACRYCHGGNAETAPHRLMAFAETEYIRERYQ